MGLKIAGVVVVWVLGWGTTTVVMLEQFEYAQGRESERGGKMAAAMALGFFWPAELVVATATFPIWGMVLLADKLAKDRHQKRRNQED